MSDRLSTIRGQIDLVFLTMARAIGGIEPLILAGLFTIGVLLVYAFVPLAQNADDLLPTIMSAQKLTLYTWEQNRAASLMPLLTAWIDTPSRNAEAQLFLRILTGLLAPLFFCALYYSDWRRIWRATVAADCLLLFAANQPIMHQLCVVYEPHGNTLTCAALAVFALRQAGPPASAQARAILGGVLLVVAYMVDIALLVVALPLLAVWTALRPSAERARLLILNLLAATIALLAPAAFAPQYSTHLESVLSLEGIRRFGAEVLTANGVVFPLAGLLPVVLALLALGAVKRRQALLSLGAFSSACLLAALALFLVDSFSRHVALNDYDMRYFILGDIAIIALGGIGLCEVLHLTSTVSTTRPVIRTLVLCLLLAIGKGRLAATGMPSLDLIRPAEAAMAHAAAERVTALNLDGIEGNYWKVWPSVFAAEEMRHVLGGRTWQIMGVTQRGEVRRDAFLARLLAKGSMRLACIDFDTDRCRNEVDVVMTVPGIVSHEFAPPEALPDGHTIRFMEFNPPPR